MNLLNGLEVKNFLTFSRNFHGEVKKNHIRNLLPNRREVTYMVYFTKGAGKYEILIPSEGKNYFPERPKGSKILSRAAVGRKGKYFMTFWPRV